MRGIAAALAALPLGESYLDGELCALRPDGTSSFSLMQQAGDANVQASLVYFAFDVLHAKGESLLRLPLTERKERLRLRLAGAPDAIQFSDHHQGEGGRFYQHACRLSLEGVVSKRADSPYVPGNRFVGEDQVPQQRRVRRRRLDRPGGKPALAGSAAARLL
jgi:ATP-dependent DNA ligase